jgi:antirestriction protein
MYEQPPEHTPEQATNTKPRIYVASLSDYNNGILHGAWIDATDDPETMQDGIDEVLATSPTARRCGLPAEEWAIHDHDGFGPISISEHAALSTVAAYAEGITEHGPAYAAWIAHLGGQPHDERFEDVYQGEWPSLSDYAEQLLDDIGLYAIIDQHVPDGLRPLVVVDVDGFSRDLQLGGDIAAVDTPDGGVWIFLSN